MANLTSTGELKVKFYWSLIGAVIAALVASVCCLGPVVLVLLGITGAWIGNLTALEPYRPIFMILTVGLLGIGFYQVYKRDKADACSPEGICAHPHTNRAKKMLLWIATILISVLLIFPYLIPYVLATGADQGAPTKQVVLEVRNMTCSACTVAVKKSLEKVTGVRQAKVTLDPPEAVVVYDPVKTSVEKLLRATTNAGFPSSVKKEKEIK